MKCAGYCIHVTVLEPLLQWFPTKVDSPILPPNKSSSPVWRASKPLNIRQLSVGSHRIDKTRKCKWLVSYSDKPPMSQPKPHLLPKHSPKCHWQTSPHRLYFCDFANLYHKHNKAMVTDNCL